MFPRACLVPSPRLCRPLVPPDAPPLRTPLLPAIQPAMSRSLALQPLVQPRRPRRAAAFAPVPPPAPVVAGSVALATPFFIAAVLFGERIVRQRRCARCEGSGLVRYGADDQYWKRCDVCGGFLPWQSWRRFFLG